MRKFNNYGMTLVEAEVFGKTISIQADFFVKRQKETNKKDNIKDNIKQKRIHTFTFFKVQLIVGQLVRS